MEAVVRRWACRNDKEHWRRWKQLGGRSIGRTPGDVVKKSALKRKLMEKTGDRCGDCGQVFAAPALQMHRLDQSFAHDRTRNFGYVEENVALACAPCHELCE